MQAPEMQSLRSTVRATPRSPRYNFFDAIGSFDLLGYAQLRASGSGIRALFLLRRLDRFRCHQCKVVIGVALRFRPFWFVQPFPAMVAEKVFHDPVLQ